MGFAFKRRALVGMVSGVGFVFAASAYAGYASTPAVSINDTARTAEGSFVGARNSGNSVEYIGVSVDQYGVSYYAKDAAGTYRSCGHPGAPSTDERIAIATINNQSWFRFGWQAGSGYCTGLPLVQNSSYLSSP